jgi:hypothetical protein
MPKPPPFPSGGRRRKTLLALATLAATLLVPAGAASAAPVSSHSPLFCTSPQLASQDYFDVLITGNGPDALLPGQPVAVNNAHMQIVVGVKGVNVLTNLLNADTISGAVTRFDIATTNATPGIVDLAAGAPMQFGPQPIVVGQPLVVNVVPPGATIGTFTAGTAGLLSLSTGHVEIHAHVSSATNPLGNQDISISCDQGVPVPFVLTSVGQPPKAPAAGAKGNGVSAQSTHPRKLRRLTMRLQGLSERCSSKSARHMRVRVKHARGGVRELVVHLDGHLAKRQDASGRRMTLHLKQGQRHQRLRIRVTDESGRSVRLRRTLCLR